MCFPCQTLGTIKKWAMSACKEKKESLCLWVYMRPGRACSLCLAGVWAPRRLARLSVHPPWCACWSYGRRNADGFFVDGRALLLLSFAPARAADAFWAGLKKGDSVPPATFGRTCVLFALGTLQLWICRKGTGVNVPRLSPCASLSSPKVGLSWPVVWLLRLATYPFSNDIRTSCSSRWRRRP